MDLISIEEVKDFLKTHPFGLKATQPRLSFPIIRRIHRKMLKGIPFDDINVDEPVVVNGHHRYVCSLITGKPIGRNPWTKPMNAVQYEWADVLVDEKDWDRDEDVTMHNENDAHKMGIDVRALDKLIE